MASDQFFDDSSNSSIFGNFVDKKDEFVQSFMNSRFSSNFPTGDRKMEQICSTWLFEEFYCSSFRASI